MLGLLVWVACGVTEPEEVSVLLRSAPAAPQAPPTPAAPSCDAAAFPVALDIGHTPEAPGATRYRVSTVMAESCTSNPRATRTAFTVSPRSGAISVYTACRGKVSSR